MNVQGLHLYLAPDPVFPQFQRLRFEAIDITLEDVFQRGIHPHSLTTATGNDSWSTCDAILARLNADKAMVPDLAAHQLGHAITKVGCGSGRRSSPQYMLNPLLVQIAKSVYFVDDISYDALLELAIRHLRQTWCNVVASELLQGVAYGFTASRAFLKQKHPNLKIAGYQDLHNLDLGRLLSVDDFLTEDRLLISRGLPLGNFRRKRSLTGLTDDQGRLCLTSSIRHCEVNWHLRPMVADALLYYTCTVQGDHVSWVPTLGADEQQRAIARNLAESWGTSVNGYCFTSTLKGLVIALENEHVRLKFPGLHYGQPEKPRQATATLVTTGVAVFGVHAKLHAGCTNDDLQDVLRSFGEKVSGNKEQLIRRVKRLLAHEYAQQEKAMDRYFSEHRFIRLTGVTRWQHRFPVLEDHDLQQPLLVLYILRHLRGNTILEASHVNQSVDIADLVDAMLHRRVQMDGRFVAVLNPNPIPKEIIP